MATVDIKIRNNIHQLACNDGEETVLCTLGDSISQRVNRLSTSFSRAKDETLLLMVALSLEDELNDLKRKNHQLSLNMRQNSDKSKKEQVQEEISLAESLDAISDYIENLVKRIETYYNK